MGEDAAPVFRDRHDKVRYRLACEVARRILADPTLIENGRRYLQRHMQAPQERRYRDLWLSLLDRTPADIASALTAPGPEGDLARETAPVFVVIPNEVRTRIIRGA